LGQEENLDVFQVLRFVEKPDEDRARSMLESGDYAWNSGMFVWRVARITEEFERQMPELNSKLNQISKAWYQPQRSSVIQKIWPQIQPETIDYGIMENANDVVVIPAQGLGWNDVGSWDALFEVLSADEDGNILTDDVCIPLDSKGNLIYKKNADRLVVTIGIEDLVIVDVDDVLLVCRKDQAQKVRQVVKQLRETRQEYL